MTSRENRGNTVAHSIGESATVLKNRCLTKQLLACRVWLHQIFRTYWRIFFPSVASDSGILLRWLVCKFKCLRNYLFKKQRSSIIVSAWRNLNRQQHWAIRMNV